MSTIDSKLSTLSPTQQGMTQAAESIQPTPLEEFNVFIRLVNGAAQGSGQVLPTLEVLGYDRGLEITDYNYPEDFIITVNGYGFNLGQEMNGKATGVFEFQDANISGNSDSEKQDFTLVVIYAKRDLQQEPKPVSLKIPLTEVLHEHPRADKKILVWFTFGDPETGGGGQGEYGSCDENTPPPPPPFWLSAESSFSF